VTHGIWRGGLQRIWKRRRVEGENVCGGQDNRKLDGAPPARLPAGIQVMRGWPVHGMILVESGNNPKDLSPVPDRFRPIERFFSRNNRSEIPGLASHTMPTTKSPQLQVIQSLDRGLAILQLVAKSKHPVTLGELAELLSIDRSSAFRLAQTLRRRGFLSCPPGRKDYVLGSSMWTLSRQYDWSNVLVKVAHPDLNHLAMQINETAHLAIREGKQALFVDSAHAARVIAVAGQTGELVPLYCTAHGKALLADADERELRSLFGPGPLQIYTKNTINTIKALVRECAVIREHGYATDEAEYAEEMRCIAAPIRFNGDIVGSIGISAPSTRFTKNLYPEYAEKVCLVAERIGTALGQTGSKD
jgi:DNA-binding IclR family transcriptional regulator